MLSNTGDPFLGGFIAKAIPKVLGVGRKLIGFGKKAAPRVRDVVQRVSRSSIAKGTAGVAGSVAVGVAAEKVLGSGGTAALGPGGLPPRGYHVIRKGKNAGKLARNRHMRVTNPRALRRSIRRASGFAKLAKRVLRFTSPRAPKGRAFFKKRRRA